MTIKYGLIKNIAYTSIYSCITILIYFIINMLKFILLETII